jgi:hypothetical protein
MTRQLKLNNMRFSYRSDNKTFLVIIKDAWISEIFVSDPVPRQWSDGRSATERFFADFVERGCGEEFGGSVIEREAKVKISTWLRFERFEESGAT